MLIPVRCFTCGKVVGSYWTSFITCIQNGKTTEEALEYINFTRTCCRSLMITNVDLLHKRIINKTQNL